MSDSSSLDPKLRELLGDCIMPQNNPPPENRPYAPYQFQESAHLVEERGMRCCLLTSAQIDASRNDGDSIAEGNFSAEIGRVIQALDELGDKTDNELKAIDMLESFEGGIDDATETIDGALALLRSETDLERKEHLDDVVFHLAQLKKGVWDVMDFRAQRAPKEEEGQEWTGLSWGSVPGDGRNIDPKLAKKVHEWFPRSQEDGGVKGDDGSDSTPAP